MTSSLHIVMLPWLAMGHLLAFLELTSTSPAAAIASPSSPPIQHPPRFLPAVPPNLSSLIHLLELSMPPHLSDHPENTTDISSDEARPQLSQAYNSFQPQISLFLLQHHVDWILFDFSALTWAPRIAAEHGAASAFLVLCNAAVLTFWGGRKLFCSPSPPDDLTAVPEWIPFPTTVAYRLHEARQLLLASWINDTPITDASPFDSATIIAIRSCGELEKEWLELLSNLYEMPVVPVGLLPPSATEAPNDEGWAGYIMDWVDKQELGSVVRVPFVWAAKAAAPPEGFEERMEGRGVVCRGWVPQVKLLAHPALIGGFLTHGGWNSLVEGMVARVVMVVLPLLFDQGLNARHMVDMGMAVEVPRDDDDGRFTGDGVAACLRRVMMDGGMRKKGRECKEVFGDEEEG